MTRCVANNMFPGALMAVLRRKIDSAEKDEDSPVRLLVATKRGGAMPGD